MSSNPVSQITSLLTVYSILTSQPTANIILPKQLFCTSTITLSVQQDHRRYHVFAYSTSLLRLTLLTMTSWSPVSHPGLVFMALFSAGSSHNCHLVASMSNVKLTYLPGTHLPMVSPKLCPYSITLRHVHHSSQYPHFLLFPKPSPVRRRHSALAFLPSDSLWLQHGSPSECSKSNFVLDDCKSSYTTPLKLNFCSLVSSHTPLKNKDRRRPCSGLRTWVHWFFDTTAHIIWHNSSLE